jgi:hypothetical protein
MPGEVGLPPILSPQNNKKMRLKNTGLKHASTLKVAITFLLLLGLSTLLHLHRDWIISISLS